MFNTFYKSLAFLNLEIWKCRIELIKKLKLQAWAKYIIDNHELNTY